MKGFANFSSIGTTKGGMVWNSSNTGSSATLYFVVWLMWRSSMTHGGSRIHTIWFYR